MNRVRFLPAPSSSRAFAFLATLAMAGGTTGASAASFVLDNVVVHPVSSPGSFTGSVWVEGDRIAGIPYAGLPLAVRVTPWSQPADLDARLAAKGWGAFDAADVMVLATLVPEPAPVALQALAAPDHAALVGALRGSTPGAIAAHAERIANAPVTYQGFALNDGRIAIMVLEGLVGTAFLVLALLGLWWAPALVGVGLVLHAIWDLLHSPRLVTTKLPAWYPAFCAAWDFVFAGAFFIHAHELAARA